RRILSDVMVHGGDLSNGRDLATLNNVSLRLSARNSLENKAGNRQRLGSVENASLFALGLSSRGDLHIRITKDSLGDSLTVILKQGQGKVDRVRLLHGREHVATEHINIVR